MSYATDRLMKNARSQLPGSLDNALRMELFNVLDEFFRNSRIWTEDVSFSVGINDPAGIVYYVEPESVSAIVSLVGVQNSSEMYHRAAMTLPGEVTLLTPPGQDDVYRATVVLSIIDPTKNDGYPEFPDWVLDKYGTGILDGVLGRMMAQPAKPYTNPKLADIRLRMFRQTISIAATESTHRNVQGAQVWRFPQTFATRSGRR